MGSKDHSHSTPARLPACLFHHCCSPLRKVSTPPRRSLIVCQDVLGCNTILVIHHTDCEQRTAAYVLRALGLVMT